MSSFTLLTYYIIEFLKMLFEDLGVFIFWALNGSKCWRFHSKLKLFLFFFFLSLHKPTMYNFGLQVYELILKQYTSFSWMKCREKVVVYWDFWEVRFQLTKILPCLLTNRMELAFLEHVLYLDYLLIGCIHLFFIYL